MSAGSDVLATLAALEPATVRVEPRGDLPAVELTLTVPGQEPVRLLFGIPAAIALGERVLEATTAASHPTWRGAS